MGAVTGGSKTGCAGGSSRKNISCQCLPRHPSFRGTRHTVFGNVLLGFGNTPVARGWSFYRRCRGLGRGIGGAWGGFRLRLLLLLLLLFAAAEEAAEDSFHLG